MGLKIRLKRTGRTGRPHYRLVVADTRAPRDGAPLDVIGYYDPRAGGAGADPAPSSGTGGGVRIDGGKVRAWIDRGARISPTAARLMRRAGVLTAGQAPPPRAARPIARAASAPRTSRASAPAA